MPPADPDGTGTATITLVGTTVNYTISTDFISGPIAQHIHQAPAGVNGPIVVNLPGSPVCLPVAPPANPCVVTGSTTTSSAIASAILANPAGFYVNGHTSDFPGGAIRGQLVAEDQIPTTSTVGLLAMALLLAVAGIFVVRRL